MKDEDMKDEEKQETTMQRGVGESLFGGPNASSRTMQRGANPFSTPSTSSQRENDTSRPNPFAPLPGVSSLAAKPAQRPEPSPPSPQKASQNSTAPTSNLRGPPSPPSAAPALHSTFASVLSLSPSSAPPQSKSTTPQVPSTTNDPPANPYPHFHLDASYETLSPAPQITSAPQKPTLDEDPSTSKDSSEKEAFESRHDATFLRFADRLAENPEQVLRYEFDGMPLLYSREDGVGRLFSPPSSSSSGPSSHITATPNPHKSSGSSSNIPRCGNCNSERVFEVQLTPHAITELEGEDIEMMGLEGMEWGTVILGVCRRDCVPMGAEVVEGNDGDGVEKVRVGYVEEWIGVQWERREIKKGP